MGSYRDRSFGWKATRSCASLHSRKPYMLIFEVPLCWWSMVKMILQPFTTDGCSGGMSWAWNKLTGHAPPWEDACVEHDMAYWAGGERDDRMEADCVLAEAVAKRSLVIAGLMFIAVRIGGHPWLPFPWRWDYGMPWPRSYRRNKR